MKVLLKRAWRVSLWAAAFIVPMIIVGEIVSSLHPDDWQPTEATVLSSTMDGALGNRLTAEWRVTSELAYEAFGHRYTTTHSMLTTTSRPDAEAARDQFPAGSSLTIYFDANDPERVSRFRDGGREGLVVAAVLMTPLVVFIAGLTCFVIVRKRRSRTTDAA